MRSDLAAFLTVFGAAVLAGGCAAAPRTATPVAVKAGDPTTFWENLPRARTVSRGDALRAVAAFGGLPEDAAHADRVAAMQGKGWLAKDADTAPDAPATRGQVAAALCPILHIKGGLSMRLGFPRERYATRELAGLGILPPGSTEDQPLSGLELTRALAFAARHQETQP
jgi:hypothetical protein